MRAITTGPTSWFVTREHVAPFAAEVEYRRRARSQELRRLTTRSKLAPYDIAGFIADVKASDADEALWRAFLATHFGRLSADNPKQRDSAGRFLCGFTDEPVWTWKRVSTNLDHLAVWLHDHADEIRGLAFGNHRKFESKKPWGLYDLIASFVSWVEANGGSPAAAFDIADATSPKTRYKVLYHKLQGARTLSRFGPLARFDLLDLIGTMGIMEVEADSCHVADSSGPLRGALKLCRLPSDDHSRDTRAKMGFIADRLAERLRMRYPVIEDALCCWQK